MLMQSEGEELGRKIEQKGENSTSAFPAIHLPAGPLIPDALAVHVDRVGTCHGPLVTASATNGQSGKYAARDGLVRTVM